ncbi:MAG: hypothetical protein R3F13_15200 [Prosthecobacter sp.]
MNFEEIIRSVLAESATPLKAPQLTKLVKSRAGRAATPKAMKAALVALEISGGVKVVMAGKTALFTTLDLESATAALLKPAIHAAKTVSQAAKLRTKLPVALQPYFDTALERLIAQGDAFVMPGAKRLVHARRPKPSELLNSAKRRTLQKVFDEINALRSPALTLNDFAAWIDGKAEAVPPPQPAESEEVLVPDESLLRGWYDEDHVRSSTMMIPISRTMERYAAWAVGCGGLADSQVLRNLLETLYNNGLILLEPCERPQDLPEQERALLVPMSLGPPGYSWCWIS